MTHFEIVLLAGVILLAIRSIMDGFIIRSLQAKLEAKPKEKE